MVRAPGGVVARARRSGSARSAPADQRTRPGCLSAAGPLASAAPAASAGRLPGPFAVDGAAPCYGSGRSSMAKTNVRTRAPAHAPQKLRRRRRPLVAPFPYFGGKRNVASLVWRALGADVPRYAEPFFGGGAVLLQRPGVPYGATEIINDADGYVANFWRACKAEPRAVAEHMRWLASELDLHARNRVLIAQRETVTERLRAEPNWYDAKLAGWWAWGASLWIGGGWADKDRMQRPHITDRIGSVRLAANENDVMGLERMVHALARRLQRVTVLCGDWTRVVTGTVLNGGRNNRGGTLHAVFLDPPYDPTLRDSGCYATDSVGLSHAVREWAIKHGQDPNARIALCGYEGEHKMPDTWSTYAWAAGGYARKGSRGDNNRRKERIWFSPHCLSVA